MTKNENLVRMHANTDEKTAQWMHGFKKDFIVQVHTQHNCLLVNVLCGA